jgi:hypothetical protein
MYAHLHETPPSVRLLQPDLPAAADQVLARALAKVPGERYGSCEDFADALQETLGLAAYHHRDAGAASVAPHDVQPVTTPIVESHGLPRPRPRRSSTDARVCAGRLGSGGWRSSTRTRRCLGGVHPARHGKVRC